MLCVLKIEGVVDNTLIEHVVEHQLPYAVSMKNGRVSV